jgi:hypothetical protein
MPKSGSIDVSVKKALWALGWNWPKAAIGFLIAGIVLMVAMDSSLGAILGAVLFFGGPVAALYGAIYVRRNVGAVAEKGMKRVKNEAKNVARLDDDKHETFSLVTAGGSSPPLLPKPTRKAATLVVGDSLLLVHDDATVSLPSLAWKVGDSTNEFYYDQIAGVNYNPADNREGGEFWVNLSDGHGESWTTIEDASDALHTVQDKIRAYKTKAVA